MFRIDELTKRGFEWAPPPNENPDHPILAAVRDGNVVYVSGQIPMQGGTMMIGKVSARNLQDARHAAEFCAVACLNAVGSVVDNPDDIVRVLKLTIFVNGDRLFERPTIVANAASDLLIAVFDGDTGKHARSAVCVGTPSGAMVEIEGVFRVA